MKPTLLPYFASTPIAGLPDDIQETVNDLWAQWAAKMPRNALRFRYLSMKNKFKDLELALPPQTVDKLDVTVGWPEKAVYEMANRIVLTRITSQGLGDDPFELEGVLHDNRFDLEFPLAVVSSVSQSTVFGSVTEGDTSRGEPEHLMMFHSALWATGLWDRRLRALRAALLINTVDDMGIPTEFTVLLPDWVFTCSKGAAGWQVSDVQANPLGRVPVEQFPFRPTLDRPFGKSRIDRRVMSLTDRAMAASARLEVHSELFATLKLMLMGAGKNTFLDNDGNAIPLWSFVMGRLNGIPKDEDGDVPKLETIAAQSPEPHIATLRQLTSEFSGHTGVPMSQLGISTDNPESADAKSAARQDIVQDAERQQTIYGSSLARLFEDVVMLRDRTTTPPEEMRKLSFVWRRPDQSTLAASADAGSKQVAAIPGLEGTEIGMEMLGMTPDQIARARSELRQANASSVLNRVLASRAAGEAPAEQ